MKNETLIRILPDGLKNDISYYQADTQEVLEKVIIFKNTRLRVTGKETGKIDFFCDSKICIEFLESLKSFSRSKPGFKEEFERILESQNPIRKYEHIIIYFDAAIPRVYIDIRNEISEHISKILDL